MDNEQTLVTKFQLRALARLVGDMLADVGDFYEVIEEICIGYANGVTGRADDTPHPAYTSLVKSGPGADVVVEPFGGAAQGAGYPRTKGHLRWQLVAANELRSVTDNWVGQLVTDAREEHWSWSEVGDALEVSKQAAQQRYGSFGVEK